MTDDDGKSLLEYWPWGAAIVLIGAALYAYDPSVVPSGMFNDLAQEAATVEVQEAGIGAGIVAVLTLILSLIGRLRGGGQ